MKSTIPFKKRAVILLGLLGAQYFLGVVTELYVTFPENNTSSQNWDYAKSQIILMSHIVLGIFILAIALMLFVRAYRAKDRVWKIASGLGLGSIMLAAASGAEFVSSQRGAYSLIMAVLLIPAVTSYGWVLYHDRAVSINN